MKIDLHVHTNTSDGALPPSEVIEQASQAGLDVIAIADHDTAAGVGPAQAAGAAHDVHVVPALELSASHRGRDIHILGYMVDPDALVLARHTDEARRRRDGRIREMIERLAGLDVHVEYDAVVAEAGPNAQALSRPHLARVLWSEGHVSSVAQAFDRYIADDGPAYVPLPAVGVPGAIDRIHEAGGIAVWAHPPMPLLGGALQEFVAAGLDGLECYRPRVTPPDLDRLLHKARRHELVVTGGSDWHGHWHGDLGTFYLEPNVLTEFLARAGI